MGVIAEGFVTYARPLLDSTDGSEEQVNKAFALTQFCFNLALLPENKRDEMIATMRESLEMDDEEFEELRRDVITPMVQRHEDMFPLMHQRGPMIPSRERPKRKPRPQTPIRTEKSSKPRRNAPCPCNSGRKYKHCCRR